MNNPQKKRSQGKGVNTAVVVIGIVALVCIAAAGLFLISKIIAPGFLTAFSRQTQAAPAVQLIPTIDLGVAPETPTLALPSPTAAAVDPEPTPAPSATAQMAIDFLEDFEYGVSGKWFGDTPAMTMTEGRLAMSDAASVIYVGDASWNHYSLAFDACASGSDTADLIILYAVRPNNNPVYTSFAYDLFGQLDPASADADILWLNEYPEDGSNRILEEITLSSRLWSSRCNKVLMNVSGPNAELFWNGTSLHFLTAETELDGAVGLNFSKNVTIDNVSIQSLP